MVLKVRRNINNKNIIHISQTRQDKQALRGMVVKGWIFVGWEVGIGFY